MSFESRSNKLLRKMYDVVLRRESILHRTASAGLVYFRQSYQKVRQVLSRSSDMLRRLIPSAAPVIRQVLPHTVDTLEPRVLLSGNSIGDATLIEFDEDPASSGYSVALANEDIGGQGEVDYWSFDALAGDVINMHVDTPTGSLNPYLELRNNADGNLRTDANGGPDGDSLINHYTVPVSGRYYARITGSSSTTGDYQLRIERAQGIGLESDPNYSNDTIGGANVLPLAASGTQITSTMGGVVMANQGSNLDEDTFLIGYLNGSMVVNLSLDLPSTSTLSGKVTLLDSAGAVMTDTDGDTEDDSFTGSTTTPGAYYARVEAVSGAGADATYLLQLSINDSQSPTVEDVPGLPAEGQTSSNLLYLFNVLFDEELDPATVVAGAFDLRASGVDGLFGTADDVIYDIDLGYGGYQRGRTVPLVVTDGPLRDGDYRFRINSTVTDVVGNTLDGDDNGIGGDVYDLTFTVDLPPESENVVFENNDNDVQANATTLPIIADSVESSLLFGRGVGYIYPATYANYWSDPDWWSFDAQAGDRIAVRVDSPNSDLDPYVELYNSGGGNIASNNSGGPDADDYISHYVIPADGTYSLRVGKYYYSTISDTYEVQVDIARGVELETDVSYNNDSINGADPITLTEVGNSRQGSVAGLIMGSEGSNTDEDRFNLGLLTAGNVVTLDLRLPANSSLVGQVRLLDSSGNVIADQDGDDTDGHLEVALTADGTYYAEVRANSGAGQFAHYILDVDVTDTIPPVVTDFTRLPYYHSESIYQSQALGQSPVLFYKLNELAGSTINDSSGNGNDGLFVGAPSLGVEGIYGPARDQAAGFDGTNDWMTVTDDGSLDMRREMSFSMWIKADSFANTWMPMIYKGAGSSGNRTYSLWLNNSGYLHFTSSDTGQQNINTANGTIKVGQWHHVAGVLDRTNGQMKIYVDGNQAASGAVRQTDTASNGNDLLIGNTSEVSSRYSSFHGTIDDFALFDSALSKNDLLAGYQQSKWQGDVRTTTQLISTLNVTVSEKLNHTLADSTNLNWQTYNGHTYVKLGAQTWASAQAWATAHGGNLVTIDDQAENDFIYGAFGNTDIMLGINDFDTEGTFVWVDGTAVSYTNWYGAEPNSGNNYDHGYMHSGNGQWYDGYFNWSQAAVVEWGSDADADSDGIPDILDNQPNDALNGYDIREAGVDGLFDTTDDVVYDVFADYNGATNISISVKDGPLAPDGEYRFTITSSLEDLVGNALDGNGDGTGGDNFVHYFNTSSIPAGTVYEGQDNGSLAKATPLTLAVDPTTPEYLFTVDEGYGSIDPASYANWWSDQDWWSFEVEVGDKIIVRVDSPGSNLDPYVELFNSSGGSVATDNSSGPNADDYISYYTATYTGTYYVRVGKYYYSTVSDTYRLNVDLVRGVQAETDKQYHNDTSANADVVTLTIDGISRVATVAGLIMGNEGATTDEDRYNIGLLNAGNVVELDVRLPASSALSPWVRLIDSNGNAVVDEDGLNDGHFLATLSAEGTYYVEVRALSGAGMNGHYVLDIDVSDPVPPAVTNVTRLPQQLPLESTYNSEVLAQSPVVYYRLNESSGTAATDSSGNGNDGVYNGTPTLDVDGIYGPTHDGAVSFDSDDYLSATDDGSLDLTSELSFSMWVKPDSFANTWMPLIYKGESNVRSYSLWLHSSGYLWWGSTDASGSQNIQTAGNVIKAGQWQHVAGVMDRVNGQLKLWVNGAQVASGSLRTGSAVSNNADLLLGHTTEVNASYTNFTGSIDDFALVGSALSEADLLKPFRQARWKGDVTDTDQLISTFNVTVSEKLNHTLADSTNLNWQTFNGHTYVKLGAQTWASAQAWATARGGNLVTIDDQAENDFIYSTFGSVDLMLGINDFDTEGTFVWADGTAVSYTNWYGAEPNSGTNYDHGYMHSGNGQWYDGYFNWSQAAVVEFGSDVDTDSDGIPDIIDNQPNDALNGYDIREAGVDGLFDTPDDDVYNVFADYNGTTNISVSVTDGPLGPGNYRFTITSSLVDLVGNALDGNGDGTGGDDYTQFFTVNPLPANVVFEGRGNSGMASAAVLTLAPDPTTPELLFTQQPGYGSIDTAQYANWWNDSDWYQFEAQVGDRIAVRVDTPGSSLDPYVGIYNDAGTELTANNSGGPDADDFISHYVAPYTGTYYTRVGKYYYSTVRDNYYVRVDIARGVELETDVEYHNDGNANADPITLTAVGHVRSGSIAGLIMGQQGTNYDEDRFNLGTLSAGSVVELDLRLPSSSTLDAQVRLFDSSGVLVPDQDGDPTNGHYLAVVGANSTYYAEVRANSGQGVEAHYILDVTITDDTAPYITGVTRLPHAAHSDSVYNSEVLAQLPVAYYRLNETNGTAATDSSGNGNAGVYNGTPTLDSVGAYGPTHDGAVNFDGDDYLSVADGGALDLTSELSFSMWIKTDAFANTWMPLMYKGDGTGGGGHTYSLWLHSNGHLQFGSADASGYQHVESAAGVIKAGQWQHIAGVMDRANGQLKLWVDGARVATGGLRTGSAVSNNDDLTIGHTVEVNSSYTNFHGSIDDFALIGSALNEADLLKPFRQARWKGDADAGTNKLIETFTVYVNEKLTEKSADSINLNWQTFNGHTYVKLGTQTWASAQAWATAHGGNLVTIDDQAENDFIYNTFGNVDLMLGINDFDTEGTFVWADGTAVSYTNWYGAEPNSGGNYDHGYMHSGNGQWYDGYFNWNQASVVEFGSDVDTDSDGIPDVIDNQPTDALNGYDIREAGVDGLFDTPDDVIYSVFANYNGATAISISVTDGPLAPGDYRMTITSTLVDLVGNALDGNSDGIGGDNYTHFFTVNPIPTGTIFEGSNNGTLATATPLPLNQDPAGSGYLVGRAFGSIDPSQYANWWNDNDWYEIQLEAGDRISLSLDTPDSSLNPRVGLYNAGGSELIVDNDGGPGADDFISDYAITTTGTYYARVGKYYYNTIRDNYELRVDVARGIDIESDREYANDSIAGADPITYQVNGSQSTATVTGTVMAGQSGNVDEDYFDLGLITTGQTILLSTRLPSDSTLRPIVEIRDANNQVVSIATNPSDAVARADVLADGHYYAVVVASEGQGHRGQYIMDIAVQSTASLDFADLIVSQVTAPTSAFSGQQVTIDWTAGNFGAVTTPGANWFDRIVLSTNDRYGDSDDIQLAVVSHTGALAVDDTYNASATVTLPIGLSGDYYVLIATDSANSISEFIFESNNVGTAPGLLTVNLTPPADLEMTVDNAPTQIIGSDTFTVDWTVQNNGTGTTGNGLFGNVVTDWTDRIVVSANDIFGDGDDFVVAEVAHSGELIVGGSYNGTFTGSLPGGNGLEGDYHLFVVTDVTDQVFEHTNVLSNSGEAGATVEILPQPYVDLTVDTVSVVPTPALSGNSIDVSWTVSNDGITATTGSWVDRVYLSTDMLFGGGDTLLGSVNQSQTVNPASQYSDTQSFTLPERISGDFYVIVVSDATNTLYEYKYENNNNGASPVLPVTLRPESDLELTVDSTPAEAALGESIQVQWTVENIGDADTFANFSDRVYMSNDAALGGDWVLLTQAGEFVSQGGSYNRTVNVNIPTNVAPGTRYLLFFADYSNAELEPNDANNFVAVPIEIKSPNLVVNSVTPDAATYNWGDSFDIDWVVENTGNGSAVANWNDRVYLSTDLILDGSDRSLGTFVTSTTPLDPQATYTQSQTVSTNLTWNLADGTYYLLVKTDVYNQQSETDNNDNVLASGPIAFAQPDLPDVQPVNAQLVQVAPQSGEMVTLQWTEQNNGLADVTSAYYSRVRVVNTDTGHVTYDRVLYYDVAANAGLTAGSDVLRSVDIQLPNGPNGAGNFDVTITSDRYNQLYESQPANTPENNNVLAGNFTTALASSPDVTVTGLTVVEPVVESGQSMTVQWSITNDGTAPITTPFYHRLTIHNSTVGQTLKTQWIYYNPASDGPINPGVSKPQSYTFTLPDGTLGSGDITVTVDADVYNQVFEYDPNYDAEANNQSQMMVTSGLAAYPDLEVSNIAVNTVDIQPGGQIEIQWALTNNGTRSITGPWSERLYFSEDAVAGSDAYIATVTYNGTLDVGQSITRMATVTLPTFVAGQRYVVITTDSNNQIFELDKTNNTDVSAATFDVPVGLQIAVANSQLIEGGSATNVTITRNGPTTDPVVITLTPTDPALVQLPATVTIPAGVSSVTFQITPNDDDLVDGDESLTIDATATGYEGASAAIDIADNDVPMLTVQLLPDPVSELEGVGGLRIRVMRNTGSTGDLTVLLANDDPQRLDIPLSATIPDGADFVDVFGDVLDNIYIDGTQQITITATTGGYVNGSDQVTFMDDDIPNLTLTAEQVTVAENAGGSATVLTITRDVVSAIDVYVQFTGVSGLLTMPTFVKIPAFESSASFTVGVVDDSQVTGDRVATITARVVDSFTSSAMESGKTTLDMTITEDDGPVLTVTVLTPAIAESGTGTGRVYRNTGTTGELVINLISSNTSEATIPATVTIPDGSSFVDFVITGVEDNVVDGANNVTVTASAVGYGGGSDIVTVTDVDLPDLDVTTLTAPAFGETSETIDVSYTVVNNGVAPVTGSWTDRVYLSSSPILDSYAVLVRQFVRNGPLIVGGDYSETFQVSLPSTIGEAYIIVQSDVVGGVEELRESNNTAISDPIDVQPAYSATVNAVITEFTPSETDPSKVSAQGLPITFNGLATRNKDGSPAAFEFVSIKLLTSGMRREITAFTAADGTYQAVFQPLSTEAGHYEVAASQPGVYDDVVQDSFVIVGMKASNISMTIVPISDHAGVLRVENRTSVPLTGITSELIQIPDGFAFAATVPDTLSGNGYVDIPYTVSTTIEDAGRARFGFKLTSAEGASLEVEVTVNIVPLFATLVTTPGSLNEGMLRGERKTLTFDIRNSGGADTGEITLTLPPTEFMRLASPDTIPSLAPGESTTVTVELNPADDLPLLLYNGQIAINSANGASRTIGYSFRAMSEAEGDVRISVVDDYTYYVEGAPKVEGATVRLSDPFTGETILLGQTGADGSILFTGVAEGSYQLEVYAPKHGTYRSRFDVKPGIVNEDEVFIQRELVTYSWNVVPVEIEDTYKVVLEPVFETNVPVPVVTIDNPNIMPLVVEGEWTQFNISLTNHGLIAAKGVQLELPDDPYYEFESLIDEVGILPAKTTIEVPVRIRAKSDALAQQLSVASAQQALRSGNAAAGDSIFASCPVDLGIPCLPKPEISAVYYYECGPDNRWHRRKADITPICVAKSIYDCIKEAAGGAASSLPSLGGNLASAPCAIIDIILQCADTGLSDCQKALIKAACKGITGAIVAGPVGAAAGVAGAAKDLLSCLCDIDWFGGSSSSGGSGYGFGGGGWGTGSATAYGGGSGGSYSTSGCNDSASAQHIQSTSDDGVCARVRLRIEQEAVLTRTGFAGTFELENGTSATTIEGIRVDIDIRDGEGNLANHLFGYRDPDVVGMGNVTGTGVLAAGQTGTARWLFVPTRDAAPTTPTAYHMGGTLTYIENGVEVSAPLLPATITVHPDPLLTMDYFLQREVFSDDPFTDEVEPSIPFTLGVLVNNTGAGNARNFKITSGQPKIIENEKGLLIDFEIIGAQVGTEEVSPSLTVDFGNIDAGTSESARWLMTSTLQGKFIEYDARVEHVDDFGNPRTSLLDEVNFHELIHALDIDLPDIGVASDQMFDFLANDIPDPEHLPDVLYTSDGSQHLVESLTNAIVDGPATLNDLQVHMTVDASATGWTYMVLDDPGANLVLKQVIRSDGSELSVDKDGHVWQTDRTFGHDTGRPIYEDRIHILDKDSTGSYTLVYGKPDEVPPIIISVQQVQPDPRNTSIDSLDVIFSEALKTGSFDTSDLMLTRDGGGNLIDGTVGITKVSDTKYTITGLDNLTGTAGDYELSIDASGIMDTWDNAGSGLSIESWTTVPNIPVVQSLDTGVTSPTNEAVSEVTVIFSKDVDPTSFDITDISLTLDGAAVALTGPVTITQVSGTEFVIEALAGLTGAEGDYIFRVDATGVTDTSANAGAGVAQSTWTVDTTAPVITVVQQLATNPRNIGVLSLDVEFSEQIDLSSFDVTDFVLTLDGGSDRFVNGLIVNQLTSTKYEISGFTAWTGVAGTYSFNVLGAGLTDLAGNAVSNDMNTTWVLDLDEPDAPTNLAITPDNGASNTDGLTNVSTVTLTGDISEAGLTVRIVDKTTDEPLGTAEVVGTSFSKELTFDIAGNHHLRVYTVDEAGNVSGDSFFDVFVDLAYPHIVSVDGLNASVMTIPVTELTINFSEDIDPATFTLDDVSLTRDGSNVTLTGVALVQNTPSQFAVTGLAALTDLMGEYQFVIDVTGLNDLAGNAGQDSVTLTWDRVGATASISDFVWHDADADGQQDINEHGIEDVTVKLFEEGGTELATTTTDADGLYRFDNLNPNDRFYLEFVAPAGHVFTTANAVADDIDSDANASTGLTESFDVAVGNNNTWDAGFIELSSISGVVWQDYNKDGVKQGNEPLLTGWTVFIDDDQDGVLDQGETSTTTNQSGAYSFGNLMPGTYIVALDMQDEWAQTHPDSEGATIQTMELNINDSGIATPLDGGESAGAVSNSDALQLIGMEDLWSDARFSHLDGTGFSTVIIDTGIDLDHSFFGPDLDNDGVADRIVFQYDFADDDYDASDYRGHGTHISSIIGSADAQLPGVVAGSDLIMLKVFSDTNAGLFSNVEKALQWVVDNSDLYNIAAVNMSFGDGKNWDWASATECGCGGTIKRDRYGLGDELVELRMKDIIVSAAAGNSFYEVNGVPGMNFPATDPATISVGAVWDTDRGGPWSFNNIGSIDYTTEADRIAAFSQRQEGVLDVFAPGAIITGAGLDGTTVAMQGTSQATAYVTGAAVVAQQLAMEHLGRRLTLTEFRTLLDTTGELVIDGDDENDNVINTGQAYTRLDVYAMAEAIVNLDPSTPPTRDGGSGETGGGEEGDVTPAANGVGYAYTVALGQGENVVNADFGVIETVPPTLDSVNVVRNAADSGQVDRLELNFSEALSVPGVITDPWVAEALSLVSLDGSGVETPIALTASQVSYNAGTHKLVVSLTGADALTVGQYEIKVLPSGITDLNGNALQSGQANDATSMNFVQSGGSGIQVDAYSVPSYADWNNDGVMDLIVGEKTIADEGKVRVYLNTGSNGSPMFNGFSYVQSNGSDLIVSAAGCMGCMPRFADLNGDSLADLIVGKADGTIDLFYNSGIAGAPAFGSAVALEAGTVGSETLVDVGDRATVEVVDWNNDGLSDLVVGDLDGKVHLFLNDGSVGSPHFTTDVLVQDGNADMDVPTGRSSVSVFDLNNDGRKDLVVGNTAGQILFYANIGSDAAPAFDGLTSVIYNSQPIDLAGDPRSRPAISDIDNDGIAELLVGSQDGVVRQYNLPIGGALLDSRFMVISLTGDTSVKPSESATYSALPNAADLIYNWNFGDGSNVVAGQGLDQVDHAFAIAGQYTITLTISDADGVTASTQLDVDVEASQVVGRYAFYNNSGADGFDPAANANDDNAIAADKQALMNGQASTEQNMTHFSRGINGIMVDIDNLIDPAGLTVDDLVFGVAGHAQAVVWQNAPTPVSISVREGAGEGGSDRVTIIWADNAIENKWLKVTIKPTAQTGLAADDVFVFGNEWVYADVNHDGVANGLDIDPFIDLLLSDHYYPSADVNRDGAVNGLDVDLFVKWILGDWERGDVNHDGNVNGFDVDPFIKTLLGGRYIKEADMNSDGVVNGLDVDPFVNAVIGGNQPSQPSAPSFLTTGFDVFDSSETEDEDQPTSNPVGQDQSLELFEHDELS